MKPLRPELERLLTDLAKLTAHARELIGTRAAGLVRARPGTESWSAAECITHLNLTQRAYLHLIDRALDQAPRAGEPPRRLRRDFPGWLLCQVLAPFAPMKSRTFAPFVPGGQEDPGLTLAEFERLQQELARRIGRADPLDIQAVRIASPFNAKLKYNLYSAFCILLVHQRRHLRQAGVALQRVQEAHTGQGG
jgi:hypothetical protein